MYHIFNSIEVPKYAEAEIPMARTSLHTESEAPTDATRNWFSFYRFHNSNLFHRCAFYDPRKTVLMEKFVKERGLVTIKTNVDAQTFMGRMRKVQQIEKEDKKRPDAKIGKVITTALQHDDASVRFDPPNRGTERNLVFRPFLRNGSDQSYG